MDNPARLQLLSSLRNTMQAWQDQEQLNWEEWQFIEWCRHFRRLKESTIETKLRQLRFMQTYDPQPVYLHGTKEMAANSFVLYLAVREEEGAKASALVNDHRAFRTFCEMVGIDTNTLPTRPHLPANQDRDIPVPEMVWELLHEQYYPNRKRDPRDALVRYMLAFSFGFAVRTPSEVFAMRVQDVDIDAGEVVITEPKKGNKRRRLFVEPTWLLESRRHLSLANWLKWRDKIDPDTDQLFPQPNGDPWASKMTQRQFLVRAVQDKFPWWQPNLGRYWGITARMIDSGFDAYRVAEWTGHTSVDRIKNEYAPQARNLFAAHGDNWLNRAFNKGSTSHRTAKDREVRTSPESGSGPARIRIGVKRPPAAKDNQATPRAHRRRGPPQRTSLL